jgi:hypothetical protein
MEDLSTKPFAFQQKVADCRTLYLACGGRHHDYIQAEMRALGHETFNKRCLYADRDKQGRRTPGWPERFGWIAGPQAASLRVSDPIRRKLTETTQDSQAGCLRSDFVRWLKRVSPGMTWDWKYQQYVYKQLKRVTDGCASG